MGDGFPICALTAVGDKLSRDGIALRMARARNTVTDNERSATREAAPPGFFVVVSLRMDASASFRSHAAIEVIGFFRSSRPIAATEVPERFHYLEHHIADESIANDAVAFSGEENRGFDIPKKLSVDPGEACKFP